jgi:penicillin amidase
VALAAVAACFPCDCEKEISDVKRAVRWGLFTVLAVVFLLAAAVLEFMSQGKPQVDGQALLPGLEAEVTVYRDEDGAPHIFADNELDAYRALGYLHAQERLFQMTLTRLMVQGRLSEVLGDKPFHQGGMPGATTVDLDRFIRTVGFHRMSRNLIPHMQPDQLRHIAAYTEGINAYIRNAHELPPDITLLQKTSGYKLEPWSAADVLAMGRFIGWFLSANWDAELMRLDAIKTLGVERGWELLPRHKHDGPYIVPDEENPFAGMTEAHKPIQDNYLPPEMDLNAIPDDLFGALLDLHQAAVASTLPFTWPFASNNWAVAPQRSESGAAILANDPHLSHMLPSIFFQAHIKTKSGLAGQGEGIDAIGATFPGMPFIVLGHNRHVAWAATTTRADTQDLFIERQNPDNPAQYWDPTTNAWRDYGKHTETLRVGGGKHPKIVEFTVRTTRHGPVISDALPELAHTAPPIALSWAGMLPGLHIDMQGRMQFVGGHIAFLGLAHANSVDQMFGILEYMDTPVQNWVFADDQGHIGFFASGIYPMRNTACDGTLPARGDITTCDWMSVSDPYDFIGTYNPAQDRLSLLPQRVLPQAKDPKQGYLISANNQVMNEAKIPFVVSFDYMSWRAGRIEKLLASKPLLTADDNRSFQMDVYMLQAEQQVPLFLAAWEKYGDKNDAATARAAKILKQWDLRADTDSVAATIFHTAYRETMALTYRDDLPARLYRQVLNSNLLHNALNNAMVSGQSSFFDNTATPGAVENRDQILAAALAAAVRSLEKQLGPNVNKWTWGRVHKVSFTHPIGAAGFPLNLLFKDYSLPAPGSIGTVFCEYSAFADDGTFPVRSGPAFRHVVDMADVQGARMIIDTGQSGHPRSPHFFDQNAKWLSGQTNPMAMDLDAIKKSARHTLVFKPAPLPAPAAQPVQDPY